MRRALVTFLCLQRHLRTKSDNSTNRFLECSWKFTSRAGFVFILGFYTYNGSTISGLKVTTVRIDFSNFVGNSKMVNNELS